MRALWSMAAGLAVLNMAVGLFMLLLPRQLSATSLPTLGEDALPESVAYPDHSYPARPCSNCLLTHRFGACGAIAQAIPETHPQPRP
jgi:hypothetical protein